MYSFETFLFYSGFFTPLSLPRNNKLANVALIIKLIIRDESVHGTYIGYKFQLGFNELPEEKSKKKLKDWMYDLLYTLYENEERVIPSSTWCWIGFEGEVAVLTLQRPASPHLELGTRSLFSSAWCQPTNLVIGAGLQAASATTFSSWCEIYLLSEVAAISGLMTITYRLE